MALTVGAVTSALSSVSDQSPTVAVPAGASAGDLFLLIWHRINAGSTCTWPSGFTEVSTAEDSNLGIGMRVAIKTAVGNETGSFYGSTSGWQPWRAVCAVLKGVQPTLDASSALGGYAYSSVAPMNGAPITTTGPNRNILWIGSTWAASMAAETASVTPPSGTTQQYIADWNNGGIIVIATALQGAQGAQTYSGSAQFASADSRSGLVSTLALTDSGPAAPTITTHPTQQTGAVGGSASFSAAASDATSYQWQSAPVTELLNDVPGAWSDIAGQTATTLSLTSLSLADHGKWFRFVATGPGGTVISESVRLFIANTGASGLAANGAASMLGWISTFKKTRQWQSNQILRADLFPGDLDTAEKAIWSDFMLPVQVGGAPAAQLAGAAQAQSAGASNLSTSIVLGGAGIAGATLSGNLTNRISLAAQPSASATLSGSLQNAVTLAAAAQTISTMTGASTAIVQLQGAGQSSAVATASLSTQGPTATLSGAGIALSTLSGALTTSIGLQASANAVASASASLATSITLASSANATSTASAGLNTAIPLGGSASASSTQAGALTNNIRMAASAGATSTVSAGLTNRVQLASTPSSTASAAGNLSTQVLLGAYGQTSSSATGELLIDSAGLSGAAFSTPTLIGTLTSAARLAGSATASSSAGATLAIPASLSAVASSQSSAVAGLTTEVSMAAAGSGAAVASASLTTRPTLAASCVSQTTASGSLSGAIKLAATASASSSAIVALNAAATLGSGAIARSTAIGTLSTMTGGLNEAEVRSLVQHELTRPGGVVDMMLYIQTRTDAAPITGPLADQASSIIEAELTQEGGVIDVVRYTQTKVDASL